MNTPITINWNAVAAIAATLTLVLFIVVEWSTLQNYKFIRITVACMVGAMVSITLLGIYKLAKAIEQFISTYNNDPLLILIGISCIGAVSYTHLTLPTR